jgi:D-serine deaminase-like pyridoxal phosphate-dependent protein
MTEFSLLARRTLAEMHTKLMHEPDTELFERLGIATQELDPPFVTLDLARLTYNAQQLRDRASTQNGRRLPIRIASKSIRSVPVLRALLAVPGFEGVLSYSLREAIMLVQAGVCDDVLVAYPTTDQGALQALATQPALRRAITLMVDHPAHLNAIEQAVATAEPPIRLCLDFDCSYRFGDLHLGARRSPIHSPAAAEAAAKIISSHPKLKLVGIMGYEAQIAGITDDRAAVRLMKRLSAPELATRRQEAVERVSRVTKLEFVNGGGTGSMETTGADPSVTELAAGSGFYCPSLFSRYSAFSPLPAMFFTLATVRRPAPRMVTVHGGGWIASGASGKDRLPSPVWPKGLSLTPAEGAGEVQTPLKCANEVPRIGSRVWFRHTKAGEPCEHVNEIHVVHGDERVAAVPTYRGEGHAFL